MDDVDTYLSTLKERFSQIDPKKYYLAYSGGKDSHLLFWFIKEYAKIDGITIVGIITKLEYPEISERIKKNCDVVLSSYLEPSEIKKRYGSPCFSKIQDEFIRRYQEGSRTKNTMNFVMGVNRIFRLNNVAREKLLNGELPKISSYCCKYLKREPVRLFNRESGLKAILGVRGDEGATRKAKYKSSFNKDGTFTPIFDLSNQLEKEIYKRYNIEMPKIYNYVDRTGCVGCPYAKRCVNDVSNIKKELMLADDALFEYVCDYFEDSYRVLDIDIEDMRKRRERRKAKRNNG